MAIHIFDTCNPDNPMAGCIAEEDSENLDPTTKWPLIKSILKVCSRHQGLSGSVLSATLVEEQQRRAKVLALSQAVLPTVTWDQHNFKYNSQGVLGVTFTGIAVSAAQKTNIQNAANSQIGAGRVKVN